MFCFYLSIFCMCGSQQSYSGITGLTIYIMPASGAAQIRSSHKVSHGTVVKEESSAKATLAPHRPQPPPPRRKRATPKVRNRQK